MNSMRRREFLNLSLTAAGGTLLFPRWAWPSAPLHEEDPQFFLQIFLRNGADQTYLFDARPLAMTAAGLQHNYLKEDPTEFIGKNGTRTLATSLTKVLKPYRDRFSIVNGMVMSPGFPGHEQNVNFALTGSDGGGECFLPHLNLAGRGVQTTTVDVLLNGGLPFTQTNGASTVPLEPASLKPLQSKLSGLPNLNAQTELGAYLRSRLAKAGAGQGRFSTAAQHLLAGFDQMDPLKDKLLRMTPSDPNTSAEQQFISFLAGAFKTNMARSAMWCPIYDFDTHAFAQAQNQPKTFGDLTAQLARIFEAMVQTPFDDKRSVLDVTTVLVMTEFSRSMRQDLVPIDQTGTDHNNFCNTAIIAGKGIRGGLVIGESDFATANETLSGAHMVMDAKKQLLMARPFDFDKFNVRRDLPQTFAVTDYINIDNVINTVYDLFHVPKEKYRSLRRDGVSAPSLKPLLA